MLKVVNLCSHTSHTVTPRQTGGAIAVRSTKEADSMQEEPTSFRIEEPGVRALFTEAARFQAWLDVEAALALAQADLDIIPASAAEEITRKAHLSYLDLEAV